MTFKTATGLNAADVDTVNALALRPFHAALGSIITSPVNWLALDDSTGEGQGATSYADRYISQVRDIIRSQFGVTGSRDYVSANYSAGVPADAKPTNSGTVNGSASYGLGNRNVSMTGVGPSQTYSIDCTDFDVNYTQGAATASFTVTVDAGAPFTVNTTNASTRCFRQWNYATNAGAPLAAGVHTIVIASTVSGNVQIEGITPYRNDLTNGFHLYDGCHSGYRTANLSAAMGFGTWADAIPVIAPSLITIGFGINDCTAVNSSQYRTDMAQLIDGVLSKASATTPPAIVIVGKYERGDATTKIEPWTNYQSVWYQLQQIYASQNKPIAVFDGTRRSVRADLDNYGLHTGDKIHMTTKGYRWFANAFSRFLLPR